MARTFVRRAERKAVEAREEDIIQSTKLMKYLNRLSDYLFTLARYYEFLATGRPNGLHPENSEKRIGQDGSAQLLCRPLRKAEVSPLITFKG